MKFDKKAINALKKSIAHWEKDIIQPMRDGRKASVDDYYVRWEDTKKIVKYLGNNCPLCQKYSKGGWCGECPYKIFYNYTCTDSGKGGHWIKFDWRPSLRTAVAMKKSLQKILDSQEEKK